MSFNLKLFFTFVVFGIFLSLFTVYSFSKITLDKQIANKVAVTEELIKIKETQISTFLTKIDHHVISISDNKVFQNFIKNDSNKEYVESLLYTISKGCTSIQSIRYVDKYGNEKINLQVSKHNQYFYNDKNKEKEINEYFIDQISTQKIGKIWHSKFNITGYEDGKGDIEVPLFITGINLGYGILEVKISLKEIISYLSDDYHRFLLVDKKGNILIDSKSNEKTQKQSIEEILKTTNLQFLQQHYSNNKNFISMKISAENADEALLLVLYGNYEELIDNEMYYVYSTILLSAITLSIFLAYFFSKPMVKMTTKLKDMNQKLDKKVEKKTTQMQDMVKLIDKYVIRSVTDTNGVITSVSEAFCNISQYSKEELLGKPHSYVRHPDMDPAIFENLWDTIKEGKNWEGKIKNLAKDGSSYWVEAHIEPNFEDGKIVSYTAIRNNITDAMLLEELNKNLNQKIKEEVTKSTEQLQMIQQEQLKSVKLTSIGSLAAGITHEINTPLTYIKGNFEMIKYDIEDLPQSETRDRILEDTEIISEGINRIGNIVESMKEVSQVSSEVAEEVNIYRTLMTSLVISSNRAKQVAPIYINNKPFNIDMDKEELKFIAKVQRQRIEQVWIIIISNALDELIKVDDYEKRRLNIDISSTEEKIIIDFYDTAGGIDESIIENIFEPFVSLKESGGIGIGLNIAKQILEENNGTIIAKNIPNGAMFTIELNI